MNDERYSEWLVNGLNSHREAVHALNELIETEKLAEGEELVVDCYYMKDKTLRYGVKVMF